MRSEACPSCRSKGNDTAGDNLKTHKNGSKYCYACGYRPNSDRDQQEVRFDTIDPGQFVAIKSRGLSKKTCQKFGVTARRYTGYLGKNMYRDSPVLVLNWFRNSNIEKQKIRDVKDSHQCIQKGNTSFKELFGRHAFAPSQDIFLTVTEGELDAMSIHEATDYPAVSISNGANSAKDEIAENLEWLMKWKHVVLCFDNDEAGRKAADECVSLFEPGKVRICFLPVKDANEMLTDGRGDEIKRLLWQAKEIFPNDLVKAEDIADRILEQPVVGKSWPYKSLTNITYGFHTGKVYILAAGTGIGKTEVAKELVLHQVRNNDIKCAMFSFEQAAEDTYRRIIGGILNVPLHIPGNTVPEEKIKEQVKHLGDKMWIFDRRNSSEELLSFDSIANKIKVLAKARGVKLIIIDNLKSISATLDDKFHGIEKCMVRLQSLAVSLGVTFIVVSHLAKDKKTSKSGEEDESWGRGRTPVLENIYGSSAIEAIADVVLVLSRNADSVDMAEKLITKVKCLKCRLDGTKRGLSFDLIYNDSKGRLEEMPI